MRTMTTAPLTSTTMTNNNSNSSNDNDNRNDNNHNDLRDCQDARMDLFIVELGDRMTLLAQETFGGQC